MSSATAATTYSESVASCRAPSRSSSSHSPASPATPAAAAAATPRSAVRRQLDFFSGGGAGGELDGDEEDEDDFLFRAAEETERSHLEAQRRASAPPPPPPPPAFPEKPCICGRGACNVEQRESGRWAYVCAARPKCKYSVWCGEADLCPNPRPAFMSHPCSPGVFNSPSNYLAGATAPTPSNLVVSNGPRSPHVSNSPSNHRAGAITPTPSNLTVSNGPRNPHVSNSPSNRRTGAATPVNASPQGTRWNDKRPICHCGAGKCMDKEIKGQNYYVCCIPKGQGACPYRVLVNAFLEESPQTGNNNNPVEHYHGKYSPVKVDGNNENGPINPYQPEYDEWPFDIVNNDVLCSGFLATAEPTLRDGIVAGESSSTQNQSNAMTEVKTPIKSAMPPPYGSGSPFTPRSNCCYRCGEDGHWSNNCPKPALSPLSSPCHNCGMLGHWRSKCPALHDTRGY